MYTITIDRQELDNLKSSLALQMAYAESMMRSAPNPHLRQQAARMREQSEETLRSLEKFDFGKVQLRPKFPQV